MHIPDCLQLECVVSLFVTLIIIFKMSKNHHPGKTALTFVFKNAEIISPNICFTGDAITTLSNDTAKRTVVNMDEWHWHKELRGETTFYIITSQKANSI